MSTDYQNLRNVARSRFGREAEKLASKIQVGARGSKLGPDWLAIDLFDKSSLIDHNWDIMNLPIPDASVDCIVCNAVLEHVPYPDLAVFEMHRVLKPRGMVWIEVPFLQPEHGYPFDFTRWTAEGIRVLMQDFEEVHSGVSFEAETWASNGLRTAYACARTEIAESAVDGVVSEIVRLKALWHRPIFYDSVHYWGRKNSEIDNVKRDWMQELKHRYVKRLLLVPRSEEANFPPASSI